MQALVGVVVVVVVHDRRSAGGVVVVSGLSDLGVAVGVLGDLVTLVVVGSFDGLGRRVAGGRRGLCDRNAHRSTRIRIGNAGMLDESAAIGSELTAVKGNALVEFGGGVAQVGFGDSGGFEFFHRVFALLEQAGQPVPDLGRVHVSLLVVKVTLVTRLSLS